MATWEDLARRAGAGFEGDVDTAAEAFTADAVLQDSPAEPVLRGREAIEEFFLAFGGRRERFLLGEVVAEGDRAAITYAVAFRADASAYGQRGMALLRRQGTQLSAWEGVWVETDEDLSTWGGD